MKPYAKKDRKICINNRSKFNSGARKVSCDLSPSELSRKIASYLWFECAYKELKGKISIEIVGISILTQWYSEYQHNKVLNADKSTLHKHVVRYRSLYHILVALRYAG